MRELTRAEISIVGGGIAASQPLQITMFDQSWHKLMHAEVQAQMERVVKEIQDSVRINS